MVEVGSFLPSLSLKFPSVFVLFSGPINLISRVYISLSVDHAFLVKVDDVTGEIRIIVPQGRFGPVYESIG